MKVLVLLVIGIILIWALKKQSSKAKFSGNQISVQPTPSPDRSIQESGNETYTGEVVQSPNGGWEINPQSTFPITLIGINKDQAVALKQILDSGYTYHMTTLYDNVAAIIARTNLKCKEIESYVNEFKPIYLHKIESLIKQCEEWNSASDMDKEDLLTEFKAEALDSIEVRPNCEVDILFEKEPQDLTFDDDLIDRYGYENITFYLRHKPKNAKMHIIPADHYFREKFEKLTELGLAVRGADIPIQIILENIKLKDLNDLVKDLGNPPFRRKAQAVEFAANLPDIFERLKRTLSFRELFLMQDLPAEFSHVSIQQLSDAWTYYSIVAELITMTYTFGGYATRDLRNRVSLGDDFLKGLEIDVLDRQRACPYCLKMAQKKYSKSNPPKVPFHIGCRCGVRPIFKEV